MASNRRVKLNIRLYVKRLTKMVYVYFRLQRSRNGDISGLYPASFLAIKLHSDTKLTLLVVKPLEQIREYLAVFIYILSSNPAGNDLFFITYMINKCRYISKLLSISFWTCDMTRAVIDIWYWKHINGKYILNNHLTRLSSFHF